MVCVKRGLRPTDEQRLRLMVVHYTRMTTGEGQSYLGGLSDASPKGVMTPSGSEGVQIPRR